MKKYLYIALFCYAAVALHAQGEWAPTGAMWYYDFSSFGASGESYLTYVSERDTVVNGINCKLIRSGEEKEIMYEESEKVYYWFDGKFRKIYDFGVNVSDNVTFEVKSNKRYSTAPIDSVITINLNNISYKNVGDASLKVITVSIPAGDKPDFFTNWPSSYTYYEKVGNRYNSFLFQISTWASPATGSPMQLRCYNDTHVSYTADWWAIMNKPCDYNLFSSIGKTEIDAPQFLINSKDRTISFKISSENAVVELTDVQGVIFLKKQINADESYLLNCSHTPPGVYIASIYSNGKRIYVRKVVF